MPAEIGTPGRAQANTASLAVTATVPAGANCIVAGVAGYRGSAITFTAAITAGGSGSLTNQVFNHRGNNNQYATLFTMFDDDANWPGTGSITITFTGNSGTPQQRGFVAFLENVDVAGTPIRATAFGESASENPINLNANIASSTDDLVVAIAGTFNQLHSDDVTKFDENGANETAFDQTGTSAAQMWRLAGTGASMDVSAGYAGTLAHSLVAISFQNAGGGGGGRIMSSLAGHGGLAGMGGIAGHGGGLAG